MRSMISLLAGSLLCTLADAFCFAALVWLVAKGVDSPGKAILVPAAISGVTFLATLLLSHAPGLTGSQQTRWLWGSCLVRAFFVTGLYAFLRSHAESNGDMSGYWMLGWGAIPLAFSAPFRSITLNATRSLQSVRRRDLFTSLMAWTWPTGLMGGFVTGSHVLIEFGLAYVVLLAGVMYVLAALWIASGGGVSVMPSGGESESAGQEHEETPSTEEHVASGRGLGAGLTYILNRRGLLSVLGFELFFWFCAGSLFVLRLWAEVMGAASKTTDLAWTCGTLGAGLLVGHLLMGSFTSRISPLFTYPLSLVMMGTGLAFLGARSWGSTTLPGGYFWALLGAGGGLLWGRIDADFMEIAREPFRVRAFALKACFRAGLLVFLFGVFAWRPDAEFRVALMANLPAMVFWSILPALLMGWMVDAGVYAERKVQIFTGVQERMSFFVAKYLWLYFSKVYFRLSIVGAGKIPRKGPLILAANHGSFLDPILMGVTMPRRVQYLMHASYYHGVGHPFFRLMMTVPVDEKSQTRALKALSKALEQEICVGYFPEGIVTHTGRLQKPEAGVIFLGKRTGAPIYPVAIKGNTRAFGRRHWIPRPFKITVIVGEPFTVPANVKRDEFSALADRMMEQLAGMLEMDPPPKMDS